MSETQTYNGVEYIIHEVRQQKFGSIKFAQNSLTLEKVVIKEISHPSQLNFLKNGGDKIICNINHPSLPKTDSISWISNDKAIIIREYFDGINLKEIIESKRLYKNINTDAIISIFCQVLEALNHLHHLKIIHSDIKPSNILVKLNSANNAPPLVKLIDLEQGLLLDSSNNITLKPFALIYSPPEQILKQTQIINVQSDIYATGITLYEALTKKKPFENKNPEITLNLQLTYPLINEHNIYHELFKIIEKATSKEPFNLPPSRLTKIEIETILIKGINKRYKKCSEFKNDLQNVTIQQQKWYDFLLNFNK